MKPNTKLISLLKDAYLIEMKMIDVLEKHAEDAKDFQSVNNKIINHMEVSKEHGKKVQSCLEKFSEEIPTISQTPKPMQTVEGMFSQLNSDKILKNIISEYATENMEIILYNSIMLLADKEGENDIAEMCSEIIAQEEDMTIWLESNLEMLVEKTLESQE